MVSGLTTNGGVEPLTLLKSPKAARLYPVAAAIRAVCQTWRGSWWGREAASSRESEVGAASGGGHGNWDGGNEADGTDRARTISMATTSEVAVRPMGSFESVKRMSSGMAAPA